MSDTPDIATVPKRRGRPPRTPTETPQPIEEGLVHGIDEVITRRPRVTSVVKRSDIIERRLKDPMGGKSLEIPCKERERDGRPVWSFYIANGDISPDMIWRMQKELGWEFCTPDDIDGVPGDFGFELRDNRLVRGHRGSEVLMKMRREDREAVLAAKDAWNRRQALGTKETKAAIVERASAELGDEPADFLHRSIAGIQVTDTMERIPESER